MLHASPGRPLVRLAVRASGARSPTGADVFAPPYSPPGSGVPAREVHGGSQDERTELAERVLYGLLSVLPPEEEPIPHAETVVAPDVVVWTPAVYARSRDEVLSALVSASAEDNALSDVQVRIVAVDVVGRRVFIEWWLTARFTNPCFVDDDLMVEPTGRLVETCGVQVATFRAEQLVRVSCYYDDLALLEQIVT